MEKLKNIVGSNLNVEVDKEIIPIFFSSDDNYLPWLSVAIRSLIDNASKDYNYIIYILNNGVTKEKADMISRMQSNNFKIEFIDVSEKIKPIISQLGLRDYYTVAIYFRLFIASMFPQYKKALYLDCDIVVLGDISKLYNTELDDNILGGVLEQIVASNKYFREYSKRALGLDYTHYINSGILVMNLEAFRKYEIEKRFVDILVTHNFDTIAPDQDYLNFLCKGKIKMLDMGWNKECLRDNFKGTLNLIHYAYFKKPWTDYYVKYGKYFWKYAKETEYFDYITNFRRNFTISKRINNVIAHQNLVKRAKNIYNSNHNFYKVLEEPFQEKVSDVLFNNNEDAVAVENTEFITR